MILSADSAGTMHWENSAAHGTHGGSGGTGDGYISALDLDVAAGSATLGRITAIRQPGGVLIRTPQSTPDLHYTEAEVDALVAGLQASISALRGRKIVFLVLSPDHC